MVSVPESQAPVLLNVVPLSEEICKGTHPVSYNSGEIQCALLLSSTYPAVFMWLLNLSLQKEMLIFSQSNKRSLITSAIKQHLTCTQSQNSYWTWLQGQQSLSHQSLTQNMERCPHSTVCSPCSSSSEIRTWSGMSTSLCSSHSFLHMSVLSKMKRKRYLKNLFICQMWKYFNVKLIINMF